MTRVRPLAERFWEKVEIAGPEECWKWLAGCTSDGYGVLTSSEGKQLRAHRVAWGLENGEIPEGLFICHSCDTPLCVNPAHLWPGTHTDNQRDATTKGRSPGAKLTVEEVILIRMVHPAQTFEELAETFQIHSFTVRQVVAGRTFKNVELPIGGA